VLQSTDKIIYSHFYLGETSKNQSLHSVYKMLVLALSIFSVDVLVLHSYPIKVSNKTAKGFTILAGYGTQVFSACVAPVIYLNV
jgi:hypothetical protein